MCRGCRYRRKLRRLDAHRRQAARRIARTRAQKREAIEARQYEEALVREEAAVRMAQSVIERNVKIQETMAQKTEERVRQNAEAWCSRIRGGVV